MPLWALAHATSKPGCDPIWFVLVQQLTDENCDLGWVVVTEKGHGDLERKVGRRW